MIEKILLDIKNKFKPEEYEIDPVDIKIPKKDLEFLEFSVNPIEGIQIKKDNKNENIWYAYIKGPIDTPYQEGKFTLQITFPADYPFVMPEFQFLNRIYHPNVCADEDGQFKGYIYIWCLNRSSWIPNTTLRSILEKINAIFTNPCKCSALNKEAEYLYHNDMHQFNVKAAEFTNKYAEDMEQKEIKQKNIQIQITKFFMK